MKKIIYTFPLTKNESIEMRLIGIYQNSIENIFYNSFVHVFFNESNIYTLLAYDTLNDICALLKFLCRETLKGDYYLDEKCLPDIGIIYNENFYKTMRSNSEEEESHNILKCIDKFILWPTVLSKNNMKAWMYNDGDGQIILFIAPVYRFTFSSKRVKGYISYDEWIKSYKPFVKRVVTREIAQEWVKQAEEIMALIEKNSSPYLLNNAKIRQ